MRLRIFPCLAAIVLAAVASASDRPSKPALSFPDDTFAFSNDTVFAYGTDEEGEMTMRRKEKPPEFSHRCLILTRATLQFHKFARFDLSRPKLSDAEYRRLTRQLSRIPVWFSAQPAKRRVVFPGYANLHTFTRGRQFMLKEELGNWLATYFRIGNWRIIFAMPRSGQARLARWLTLRLDHGEPTALFLARFPHMNHAVIAFDYRREAGGGIKFIVYDPNYPNDPAWVRYRANARSFDFEKRWYFPGGRVNVMRTYISPIH